MRQTKDIKENNMTKEQAKGIISYHKHLVDKDKSGLLIKEIEYQAIDMAIRALEQELVLDKIKAEIEQEYKVEYENPYGQGLKQAIEIINKYITESEE